MGRATAAAGELPPLRDAECDVGRALRDHRLEVVADRPEPEEPHSATRVLPSKPARHSGRFLSARAMRPQSASPASSSGVRARIIGGSAPPSLAAADDPLQVGLQSNKARAHLARVSVQVVDALDLLPEGVAEHALGDVRRDAQPGQVGPERPSEVVPRPGARAGHLVHPPERLRELADGAPGPADGNSSVSPATRGMGSRMASIAGRWAAVTFAGLVPPAASATARDRSRTQASAPQPARRGARRKG